MRNEFDPWTDLDCQQQFCLENGEDFDLWLSNKGIDPRFDDNSKYELSYCEKNEAEYLKFAAKYEKSLEEE